MDAALILKHTAHQHEHKRTQANICPQLRRGLSAQTLPLPFAKRIVVTGLPRSGSTFVWQVLTDLVKTPDMVIPKFHGSVAQNLAPAIVIATVRHPLQSLCSWLLALDKKCCWDDAESWVKDWTAYLDDIRLHEGAYHVLRYEHFVPDHERLYDQLEVVLNVTIDPTNRQTLSERHSQNRNEAIAATVSYASFGQGHDSVSLIHKHHVTHSRPWSQLFSDADQKRLKKALQQNMVYFGYS